MGDTVVIVISIILAAILMFVFPMMMMSSQNDKIAQEVVQSTTADYVATISTTGVITEEEYDKFVQAIYATGNTYDIEFEVQKPDNNEAKKTTTVEGTKTGEYEYFSVFTNDVIEGLKVNHKYPLPKNSIVKVTVKNNNKTLFQTLQSAFYSTTTDSYQIAAQQSAIVRAEGV